MQMWRRCAILRPEQMLPPARFVCFLSVTSGTYCSDTQPRLVCMSANPKRVPLMALAMLPRTTMWATCDLQASMQATACHAGACARHYTFYIWKDVINAHPATRYALAPAYVYAAWSLREALAAGPRPLLWAAGLAACTAAVLVPSPLVELRCAVPDPSSKPCNRAILWAASLAACTAAVPVPPPLVELRCAALKPFTLAQNPAIKRLCGPPASPRASRRCSRPRPRWSCGALALTVRKR